MITRFTDLPHVQFRSTGDLNTYNCTISLGDTVGVHIPDVILNPKSLTESFYEDIAGYLCGADAFWIYLLRAVGFEVVPAYLTGDAP